MLSECSWRRWIQCTIVSAWDSAPTNCHLTLFQLLTFLLCSHIKTNPSNKIQHFHRTLQLWVYVCDRRLRICHSQEFLASSFRVIRALWDLNTAAGPQSPHSADNRTLGPLDPVSSDELTQDFVFILSKPWWRKPKTQIKLSSWTHIC